MVLIGEDGQREMRDLRWGLPSPAWVVQKAAKERAEKLRAKGKDYDWEELLLMIYYVYRAVYLRSAWLTARGLEERKRRALLDDGGIRQLAGAVLAEAELNHAVNQWDGFGLILNQLEAVFLQEAVRVMSGSKAVAESLADMQATLKLHAVSQ